jgi:diacylglycerol kinase family enzyme/membrane-associated phospholipid phosphatase
VLRPFTPARLHAADLWLFRRVAAVRPGPADRLARTLSVLADHGKLWVGVAAALASDGRAGRRAALRGLVSLGLASAVVNLPAKLAARRARPDLRVVPAARRLARVPTSGSLPSGHAASAAAFTTGVALEAPQRALPVGLLAAAVAYSRVHTGVHYPGDVAVGLGMGVGAAFAVRHWWPSADPRPAIEVMRTSGPDLDLPQGEGLAVVVNEAAGGSRPAADRISALLPRATCHVVEDGERLEDALTQAAAGARALGIAGGDGSVNAAARIAHAAELPLAVFPSGTLNHFATDLGMATLADTAGAVLGGHTALVDVAEVDGHRFVNAMTLGAYPALVTARERLQDRIGKWPALAIGAMRVLRRSRPVAVTVNGVDRRLWLAYVGNCRYEPSGFTPQRRSRLDDGVLDVRLVDGAPPLAGVRLLIALATGRLARSGLYQEYTATTLHIRAPGPLRLSRDGEVFDGSSAFRVAKHRTPLRVLVPA